MSCDGAAAFRAASGWAAAALHRLPGDASARRYTRLVRDGQTALLMEDPGGAPGVDRFAAIARHLAALGLSPPAILACDPDRGLMLLEDLGDALYARRIEAAPGDAGRLYAAAVDALVVIATHPPPRDVPHYDAERMTGAVVELLDWIAPAPGGRDALAAALQAALDALGPATGLTLRDVHAENLFWLPDRAGAARVGLIDFQDAVLCHPAYDLASLLADARRDVAPGVAAQAAARFGAATGLTADDLDRAVATLTIQRNLRILGLFTRFARRDGRPGYLVHRPRLCAQIARALRHPDLAALRGAVAAHLPELAP